MTNCRRRDRVRHSAGHGAGKKPEICAPSVTCAGWPIASVVMMRGPHPLRCLQGSPLSNLPTPPLEWLSRPQGSPCWQPTASGPPAASFPLRVSRRAPISTVRLPWPLRSLVVALFSRTHVHLSSSVGSPSKRTRNPPRRNPAPRAHLPRPSTPHATPLSDLPRHAPLCPVAVSFYKSAALFCSLRPAREILT